MQFGTDGVRGVANTELTTEFATRLGRAAPSARDRRRDRCRRRRHSRIHPMLDRALCAGFAAEGLDVIRLGVAPTPQVAFEAQRRGALGAVVSASHNPWTDNGIKLFARGGVKLRPTSRGRIEAELAARAPAPAPPAPRSCRRRRRSRRVRRPRGRPSSRARLDGLRVVLDAANGAARDRPRGARGAGAEVS
jgi:phosphoglucosamine mutase